MSAPAAACTRRRAVAVESGAPVAVVTALLLVQLATILVLNDGHFIFSLDDPYIHLALAENLAHGHYGINLSEPSAPSSSVLWPFLLIPFAGTAFHDEWPLLINVACALASVVMLQAIVRRTLAARAAVPAYLAPTIVVAAALGLNLVGLVFTGMEHSLHVLLALAVALGLIIEAEERRVPWFLVAAIILGPLVRYEGLAPSLAAILFLGLRGRAGLAVLLFASCVAPLIGFSWFLHSMGLGWLPSSVLLKSQISPDTTGAVDMIWAGVTGFVRNLPLHPSLFVLVAFLLLLIRAGFRAARSAERHLALAASVAIVLHVMAGRYGWFGRYEIYILAFSATILVHVWRGELLARLGAVAPHRGVIWIAAGTAALFGPSLGTLLLTPLATRNIYEQQYQMHRLVTEFHNGPVAVNDLGWVSYRNDGYVLDLWGLGSIEAGIQRLRQTPGWMATLAAEKGIDLALIYEDWYAGQIPDSWQLLGRLHLGSLQVTAARDVVAFFAVNPAASRRLSGELARFAASLPAGVRFEFVPRSEVAPRG